MCFEHINKLETYGVFLLIFNYHHDINVKNHCKSTMLTINDLLPLLLFIFQLAKDVL